MNLQISTEQPLWFIFFCILLAVGVSWFLYRKDKAFNDLPKWKIWLMSVLRSIFVFVLSFLLLSPLLNSVRTIIDKPIIVIAQDNSESILFNKDSAFYRSDYQNDLNEFVQKLGNDFEVQQYSFSDKLDEDFKNDFSGKSSNLSQVFTEIENRYANRNVGAVVFASDGNYNTGSNPAVAARKLKAPVYSIALGDTSQNVDIRISELNHNKFAFLGNNFPLQVYVSARQAGQLSSRLIVKHQGNEIFSQDINVASDPFSEIINMEIEAKQKGLQRYTVELKSLENEPNLHNNKQEFVMDVIDSKQKILILANSPHPDIGAIQRALENNINFEVELSTPKDFTGDIQKYNLVILHQLPSTTQSATELLADIKKYKVPALYILGAQSDMNKLNSLQAGVEINQNKSTFEYAEAFANDKFSLFEFSEDNMKLIGRFPPLYVPFGGYSVANNPDVFLYQKIKNIETNKPLISFHTDGDHKTGFIVGEGIWRWRIQNYFQVSNHELFDELVNKIVQYLALRIKKERFVVNVGNVYSETESIVFNAEVYNESYELDNKAEVELQIRDSEDKVYQYAFNKFNSSYRLDVGAFPAGDYTYKANVKMAGENFTKTGKFSVVPVNTEAINTTANHQILYKIAKESNGKLFYPNQFDALYNELKENKSIVSISRKEQTLTELINLKWIFFVLLLFISIEWFMRKYHGGY